MNDPFNSIIESSQSILIFLPTKSDFDHVAASLALYLSLRAKKNTAITCPSQMLVEFNNLVGVDKITTEPGNKNLVIKFVDYNTNNVEKVSYDIKGGEFYLTVAPKEGFEPPKENQVHLSYSGGQADTIILVGGENQEQFSPIISKNIDPSKIIHIGTKDIAFPPDKKPVSLSKPTSSLSELVATLIKDNDLKLDADIATNLLMGITEKARDLKDTELTAETFQTIADLMRAGGQRSRSTQIGRKTYPLGSIPGQVQSIKSPKPPKDWLGPKIYKGTTIN
jgi:nanoRNase/pAp phosphatase (c-di-AMP/oligoRNAs hydrolase)